MTTGEELLIILTSYHKGYKLMRAQMRRQTGPTEFFFLKKSLPHHKERTLSVVLSRLKKQGLVENKNGAWNGTKEGMIYIKERVAAILNQTSTLPKHLSRDHHSNNKLKNMIIAFDIPEKHYKKRNWLRIELTGLGFEQLQKSVWLGPTPLPKEFIQSLDDLAILDHLQFFKASRYDIV